jgi:hypothetical protein
MNNIPIRVLLYKAAVDGRPIDDLIAGWTWTWNFWRRWKLTPDKRAMLHRWSHAELWTPNISGGFEQAGRYCGDCWTSTMGALRDPDSEETSGTVRRPAAEILRHPDRWSVSDDLLLPEPVYNDLLGYMDAKVKSNKGYDRKAIYSFLTPWRFHSLNKEICSEHVHDNLLYAAMALTMHSIVHPVGIDSANCRKLDDYGKNYAEPAVPSPLLLGIHLILIGIKFRDLICQQRLV